jgi:ribosomal protein L44E
MYKGRSVGDSARYAEVEHADVDVDPETPHIKAEDEDNKEALEDAGLEEEKKLEYADGGPDDPERKAKVAPLVAAAAGGMGKIGARAGRAAGETVAGMAMGSGDTGDETSCSCKAESVEKEITAFGKPKPMKEGEQEALDSATKPFNTRAAGSIDEEKTKAYIDLLNINTQIKKDEFDALRGKLGLPKPSSASTSTTGSKFGQKPGQKQPKKPKVNAGGSKQYPKNNMSRTQPGDVTSRGQTSRTKPDKVYRETHEGNKLMTPGQAARFDRKVPKRLQDDPNFKPGQTVVNPRQEKVDKALELIEQIKKKRQIDKGNPNAGRGTKRGQRHFNTYGHYPKMRPSHSPTAKVPVKDECINCKRDEARYGKRPSLASLEAQNPEPNMKKPRALGEGLRADTATTGGKTKDMTVTPEARRGRIQDTKPSDVTPNNQNRLAQERDFINEGKKIKPTGADAKFSNPEALKDGSDARVYTEPARGGFAGREPGITRDEAESRSHYDVDQARHTNKPVDDEEAEGVKKEDKLNKPVEISGQRCSVDEEARTVKAYLHDNGKDETLEDVKRAYGDPQMEANCSEDGVNGKQRMDVDEEAEAFKPTDEIEITAGASGGAANTVSGESQAEGLEKTRRRAWYGDQTSTKPQKRRTPQRDVSHMSDPQSDKEDRRWDEGQRRRTVLPDGRKKDHDGQTPGGAGGVRSGAAYDNAQQDTGTKDNPREVKEENCKDCEEDQFYLSDGNKYNKAVIDIENINLMLKKRHL